MYRSLDFMDISRYIEIGGYFDLKNKSMGWKLVKAPRNIWKNFLKN